MQERIKRQLDKAYKAWCLANDPAVKDTAEGRMANTMCQQILGAYSISQTEFDTYCSVMQAEKSGGESVSTSDIARYVSKKDPLWLPMDHIWLISYVLPWLRAPEPGVVILAGPWAGRQYKLAVRIVTHWDQLVATTSKWCRQTGQVEAARWLTDPKMRCVMLSHIVGQIQAKAGRMRHSIPWWREVLEESEGVADAIAQAVATERKKQEVGEQQQPAQEAPKALQDRVDEVVNYAQKHQDEVFSVAMRATAVRLLENLDLASAFHASDPQRLAVAPKLLTGPVRKGSHYD